MEKAFNNRLPVSHSLIFDNEQDEIWGLISQPRNLELCHPFCKSNEVIKWDKITHSDHLIYLNGLNYIRTFQTWDEGSGYTLLIGEKNGPQSYVIWKIDSIYPKKSRLTITVYPHILAKFPIFISYIPYRIWVKPRLEKYLESVLSGFQYYLQTGKKTPPNHFGKHPWFSD